MDLNPRLLCPWDSPSKNTGVGCYAPLQGIFPTQGSNLSLLHPPLHSGWILYYYHHQGSPLIGLEISVYWDTPLLYTTDSGLSVSSLTDQSSISSPPASCGWHGIGREQQWKRWRGAAWFWTPGLREDCRGLSEPTGREHLSFSPLTSCLESPTPPQVLPARPVMTVAQIES